MAHFPTITLEIQEPGYPWVSTVEWTVDDHIEPLYKIDEDGIKPDPDPYVA